MANKQTISAGSVLSKTQALSGNLQDGNGNALNFVQQGSSQTYKDSGSGLYFDIGEPQVVIKQSGQNS
jgi:hypothetical protein